MAGRHAGALAAHPDQGGNHAAFLEWQAQDQQGAAVAGDHADHAVEHAPEIAGLLTNVAHNQDEDDDDDAFFDAADEPAPPPPTPPAPAVPTLQRLAEHALEQALTPANVASVLTLASNVLHAPRLADACAAYACKHLAAVVQTPFFDELPSDVRRRLLLCAAQERNPVGAAPGARNAFAAPREFLGIVREHVIELRWRLAEAERAQEEAVARAAAARAQRQRSRWGAFFLSGGGGGGGQQQSGVEYAEEKLVKQRRRVARVEAYHAAQSKLFAALDR